MKWLNSNTIHNVFNIILSVIGVVVPILVGLGCTEAGDTLSCANAAVPAWMLPILLAVAGAIGTIKVIMNLVRDGLGGLVKQQPPVATDVKTVVVTGDKDSVTEVKTAVAGSPAAVVVK